MVEPWGKKPSGILGKYGYKFQTGPSWRVSEKGSKRRKVKSPDRAVSTYRIKQEP